MKHKQTYQMKLKQRYHKEKLLELSLITRDIRPITRDILPSIRAITRDVLPSTHTSSISINIAQHV
jgi:hypothetical protein